MTDGDPALPLIERGEVDLAILDMVMPGLDGMTLLAQSGSENPIFRDHALRAGDDRPGRRGRQARSFGFCRKTGFFGPDHHRLGKRPVQGQAGTERNRLLGDIQSKYQMVGVSRGLKDVLLLVEKAAPSDATVLISGESGTGKELVARAIHLRSARAGKPFQVVNCAAIPEDLIESELFGHEKGSFTGAVQGQIGKFEAASDGTLFLDEIGEMSLKVQSKVLRAIENKEIQRIGGRNSISIDPRIIAASNRDLKVDVAGKRFREDLFFRMNVISVRIPPLRERREDIPLLVDYFLAGMCDERKRQLLRLPPQAMEALLLYEWPGNVRELATWSRNWSSFRRMRPLPGRKSKLF